MCVCVCVFQVETIGGAYMVVAGAPEKTKYHAHNICDMTLDGWFYWSSQRPFQWKQHPDLCGYVFS